MTFGRERPAGYDGGGLGQRRTGRQRHRRYGGEPGGSVWALSPFVRTATDIRVKQGGVHRPEYGRRAFCRQ